MRIWIDADATPREVKDIVFRAVRRLGIETVLVANRRLQPPPGNPLVRAVLVEGGPDMADQYIVEHAAAGDLVVTQDIPLAGELVPKQVPDRRSPDGRRDYRRSTAIRCPRKAGIRVSPGSNPHPTAARCLNRPKEIVVFDVQDQTRAPS